MKVLTIGTFDTLHLGHLRLLSRAAWFGPLTVGVNTDTFVKTYKGKRPAQDQQTRLEAIRGVPDVDRAELSIGAGITMIRKEEPDLLAIGSDWLDHDYCSQLGTDREELTHLGVAVIFLPRTPGVSSTELRDAA